MLHRRDAILAGITDTDLRRDCHQNNLVHIARGSYLPEPEYRELDVVDKHRARVVAAAHRHGETAVFSHISAAVLHGFDVWNAPLQAVHVTRTGARPGRRGPNVHHHPTALEPAEIVEIDGLRVTSPARTITDLARTLSLHSAVSTGDHALRLGLAVGDLAASVATATGRHGAAKARHALTLMDGRSESVGESLSRLLIREVGLPTPSLQRRVFGSGGESLGRVDFDFPGTAVVGEFDGKVKYGKYPKPGQDASDVLYREKIREDRIRDTGLVVVRWVWADLSRPLVLRSRIAEAFRRAHKWRGGPRTT